MNVLYLIQAPNALPEAYKEFLFDSNYILLSWKHETSDTTIYAPNTTWAEGRNKLWSYVKSKEELLNKYDYFCLMDDDIGFSFNWSDFEKQLFEINPPIGIPKHRFYSKNKPYLKHWVSKNFTIDSNSFNYQSMDWFDAGCNFYRKDVFLSNVFPYTTVEDHRCWWSSQFAMIILTNQFYPGGIVQFNKFNIENIMNREYPRNERDISFLVAAQNVCERIGIDHEQTKLGPVYGFNDPNEFKKYHKLSVI